jgi:membrane dipeptidase
VLVALVGVAAFALPGIIERKLNGVRWPKSPPSKQALALHAGLRGADLHADSLMQPRDLSARGTSGHVDLPRLREGRVVIQGFGIVTKTPRYMNMSHNDDSTDQIRLLAIASHWPTRTWNSLYERALYQTGKAAALEKREAGRFMVLRTRADVATLLEKNTHDAGVVGGVLGIEGAHALERDLAHVDGLFDAGVRTVGIAHFFDNEWGGSAHGMVKGGLTAEGRLLVAALEKKRMTVDLAHASRATIADVLAMSTRPVIVSHTGVAATCAGPRNLDDDQLRAIAKHDGLIGIGFWNIATCGDDPASIARAILHAVEVIGVDHVALGSDFDGAVTTPFDASGLAYVTDALLKAGASETTIRKVMGENVIAFWQRNLP